jgi:hypothetical protein
MSRRKKQPINREFREQARRGLATDVHEFARIGPAAARFLTANRPGEDFYGFNDFNGFNGFNDLNDFYCRLTPVKNRKIMIILILVAILGAALWLYARRFERSHLYFPERAYETTPSDLGLSFREISFPTSDGETITGWWLPAQSARGALLYCHGNGGNVSTNLVNARVFHDLGLSVLLFDYRGYGKSSGRPSEEGTYRDARAAFSQLTGALGIPPEQIVIYGMSLGGAVAIELAADVPAAGLICEATFTSVLDMARRLYPGLPAKILASDKYDSLSKIGRLGLPKLFLHAPEDELVPFAMGRKLFDAATAPKEFLEIRGTHGEGASLTGPAYAAGIDAFLRKILPAKR